MLGLNGVKRQTQLSTRKDGDDSLKARHVGGLKLKVFAAPSYLNREGTPLHPLDLENSHHRVIGQRKTARVHRLDRRADASTCASHSHSIFNSRESLDYFVRCYACENDCLA
jgi:hypothetical protein